jgi:hypothetical protein
VPTLPNFELEQVFGFDPKDFYQLNLEKEEKEFREALLTLSLIFNDLKNLVYVLLECERCGPSDRKKLTRYNGQFSAMHFHIQRVLIGTFFEVLEFVQKNRAIFESAEFEALTSKLTKKRREKWNELMELAESKYTKSNDFYASLMKLRHNLGFHYSRSWIGEGFEFFFTKHQKEAYVSFGENWSRARLYFADAAMQGKLMQFLPDLVKFHHILGNYVGELAGVSLNVITIFFREKKISIKKSAIPQGP